MPLNYEATIRAICAKLEIEPVEEVPAPGGIEYQRAGQTVPDSEGRVYQADFNDVWYANREGLRRSEEANPSLFGAGPHLVYLRETRDVWADTLNENQRFLIGRNTEGPGAHFVAWNGLASPEEQFPGTVAPHALNTADALAQYKEWVRERVKDFTTFVD